MCKQEYEELQSWLSYKMEHSPYNKALERCNEGWKEAMLVVKSKIKSMYKEE